ALCVCRTTGVACDMRKAHPVRGWTSHTCIVSRAVQVPQHFGNGVLCVAPLALPPDRGLNLLAGQRVEPRHTIDAVLSGHVGDDIGGDARAVDAGLPTHALAADPDLSGVAHVRPSGP